MGEWYGIVAVAFVTACVAWTVTMEEVFREFRDLMGTLRDSGRGLFWQKLAYLPTCYYCFSHWVAAVLVAGLWLFGTSITLAGSYLLGWLGVTFTAQFFLTAFHLLRVFLRWGQGKADLVHEIVKAQRRLR